ncbi:hypothetical protein [Prescottella agglutinans]|uniref:Uncharacterized protein n=1 Tax=Prescottella agglutinans TaxID=1644129 RepID=A0ABT6MAX3_9NOCA|nr:hypothetical protein [Prescottella agglutinans]MDH6280941.1 hypothetical protein [Prescottella agglutinans]
MIEYRQVINGTGVALAWRADRCSALPAHHRMDEQHHRALVSVARAYYTRTSQPGEVRYIDRGISLEDGDLSWRNGSHHLIFTIVQVPAGDFVRAISLTSDGWMTVADWPVTPSDFIGTARTIWQLISLIQAGVHDSGMF